MKINYNNTAVDVPNNSSLQAFLAGLGCDRIGVAAALNEQVVARSDWAKTILSEGDALIVIEIAQGG